MSGTLDQNAIREAKLFCQVDRPDGQGVIKLFLTSTANAPASGPGFGYKTVKSKAQVYFYYDPQRFPEGRENPQVASALQRLADEMPRHPEKFSNCESVQIRTEGEEVCNPEYSTFEKRLESFQNWPRTDLNPQKLAQVHLRFRAQLQNPCCRHFCKTRQGDHLARPNPLLQHASSYFVNAWLSHLPTEISVPLRLH
jgi:hypothetical protein